MVVFTARRKIKQWRIIRESLDEDTAYSHRVNGRHGTLICYEKYHAGDDHTERLRLDTSDLLRLLRFSRTSRSSILYRITLYTIMSLITRTASDMQTEALSTENDFYMS